MLQDADDPIEHSRAEIQSTRARAKACNATQRTPSLTPLHSHLFLSDSPLRVGTWSPSPSDSATRCSSASPSEPRTPPAFSNRSWSALKKKKKEATAEDQKACGGTLPVDLLVENFEFHRSHSLSLAIESGCSHTTTLDLTHDETLSTHDNR